MSKSAFGAKEEPQLPGATLNPLTAAEYDTVVGNVAATEPKFCKKIVWVSLHQHLQQHLKLLIVLGINCQRNIVVLRLLVH